MRRTGLRPRADCEADWNRRTPHDGGQSIGRRNRFRHAVTGRVRGSAQSVPDLRNPAVPARRLSMKAVGIHRQCIPFKAVEHALNGRVSSRRAERDK